VVWHSSTFVGEEDTVRLAGQSQINRVQVIEAKTHSLPLAKPTRSRPALGWILFSAGKRARRAAGDMLTHLTRAGTSNGEILKMANGDQWRTAGPVRARTPYPGKLGVMQEGALASYPVDGDPIATHPQHSSSSKTRSQHTPTEPHFPPVPPQAYHTPLKDGKARITRGRIVVDGDSLLICAREGHIRPRRRKPAS